MVGFLNAHGTPPCIFGGEFLDLSLVPDDEIRVGKVSVLDLPDNSSPAEAEPFDHNFEETFWSSLLIGADYDWDNEPEEDPLDWVQRRYADVILLNDELGYQRQTTEALSFTTTFIGRSRTNARNRHWADTKSLRRNNPNRDRLRGHARRAYPREVLGCRSSCAQL